MRWKVTTMAIVVSACARNADGFFSWGSKKEKAGFVASDKYGCVGFVLSDGSEKPCNMAIHSTKSGECKCAWGNEKVDPNKGTRTCQQVCFQSFPSGKVDAETPVASTRWNWNNWRDVELRKNGLFVAPTDDCMREECFWFGKQGTVYIMWGHAGLHTVKIKSEGTVLKGKRFDGEKCSAVFSGKFAEEEPEEEDGDEDLYELLGLDFDASESDIKKAYRKLSREYHPDRVKSTGKDPDQAARMFEKIRNANEVLSDADKRLLYDTGGMEAVKKFIDEGGREGRGGHDPFSMLFGGGGQNRANRGKDMEFTMRVSLEDIYKGSTVRTSVKRRVVCRGCSKINDKNRDRCSKCGSCPPEYRMVHRQMGGFIVQQQEQVPSKEKCSMTNADLKVTIEQGMKHGERIVFERMAEQTPGKLPGDIILTLEVPGHHTFQREDNDLRVNMQITLKEALTGVSRRITHLDGHQVEVETRPSDSAADIISARQTVTIEKEGMPVHNVPSQKGNLHVTFDIDFPKSLTEEQIAKLKQILPDM